MLKRPPGLKTGDTIGIVAPASPFDTEAYHRGIAALRSMGFRTFTPEGIFLKDRYLAGSDTHRANMINRLFADSSISAIICARGGFGSLRLLSMLDLEIIRQNPKIFVGFSDISAILSLLNAECNLVAFHGPVLTNLGNATPKTKQALLSALSSSEGIEVAPETGVVIKQGTASGPVSGGNLTTLCHLLGTPFAPRTQGCILLFEDRGEKTYKIDRMLTQMKMAGFFDDISGIILGSFEECGNLDDIYGIIEEMFKDRPFPILGGFEIGHGRENVTIALGMPATLDTDRQTLLYHQPAIAFER